MEWHGNISGWHTVEGMGVEVMRKLVNRQYFDMTTEEIADIAKYNAIRKTKEKYSPMSVEEASKLLLCSMLNAIPVNNESALRLKSFYPTFESIVGQKVNNGYKFTYGDKLWSVVQPELTIQEHYPPGAGMESLYEEICEEYEGTLDEPIPYNGNMALESGKYYVQSDKIYLCNRDTVNPIYHALIELVGLYVEKV